MLLRHTPKDITPTQSLDQNPAKTCQPIEPCTRLWAFTDACHTAHGSQGCCAYHRSTLTRHYKEPVMAATTLSPKVHRSSVGSQPCAGH